MRFMMIIRANEDSESGRLPTPEELATMERYNAELTRAGVMLAGEGLKASSEGALVKFTNGTPTVIDGPFAEAKELIAGYWLLDVKSPEEAIEWASRVPGGDFDLELRPLFELADFPPDVVPPEQRATTND